ncbi:GNAT family N-acetyltransferase [Novosphingobium sp. RD2P27]|uniref:GNAT family N-acetyltransferase n=1 Tax=Novosphingobium kalidii TaxID=3230299 RepID=A0ABV2D3L1_9SPHN
MKVRQASFVDLSQLTGLFDAYRQFYGQKSDVDAARRFLSDRFEHQQSVIFIADDEEAGLGFTQLYPSFSSTRMMRTLILNDLFVIPEARKRGVAKALLSAATDYARQIGALRLSLSTANDNLSAQALYDADGWVREALFVSYNKNL